MITDAVHWLEQIFSTFPLPLLEVWGRFGYIIGFILMIGAYSGLTFKPHDRWGLGLQRQTWNAKAFLSMILTFVLTLFAGYMGSTIVLVPGAQTLESLKDLSVFVCLMLFGYPALIMVPFAYGLSDLIEGVPPAFLFAWLPGYLINPSCFWLANQIIGRNPDFRLARTWRRYAVFVLVFMGIEPQMWGYLCSEQFTSALSYRTITPAVFFTMSLTWIMAPFAMLMAYPLAQRLGYFWAKIPGHVTERRFKESQGHEEGLPLRLVLVVPFIVLTLTMVAATAYMALRSSETTARKLAEALHAETAETLRLRLDTKEAPERAVRESIVGNQGLTFIIDRQGHALASSDESASQVQTLAIGSLGAELEILQKPRFFTFEVIISKPLSSESWLARATPYGSDRILVTATPLAFHQEGMRLVNSQSAMMIALALALGLIIAVILSALVTAPIARMVDATDSLAQGDLSRRIPGSRLAELQALSQSFNTMVSELQKSFHRSKLSEQMFRDLVETTPGIVWQADPVDTRILFVSPQVENLLGYSVEECLKPRFWLQRVHPLDRERTKIFYEQCMSATDTHAFEYRLLRRDGSIVWLRDTVKIIEKPGLSRYLHGVMIDITDRKIAEEELEIVNMKAETALELAKAGYWHVPLDGSGIYKSSARAVEIFGDIPNETLSYRLEEDWYSNVCLGDPVAAVKTRQNLDDALSGLAPVYDATYAYRRPIDGRVVWIHAIGKIFKNQEGVATDMFGVTQDITAFKEVEDEITHMNTLLEDRVVERTEKLIQATKNLIESSRKAGMAEVAIGVLHNIGNALTSASIKVQNLHLDYQNDVAAQHLREAMDFLKSKGSELGAFLQHDEKGQRVLPYLETISLEVQKQIDSHRSLVSQLLKDLNLISQLIAKQQSNAKFTGIVENIPVVDCLEDVLSIQTFEFETHRIRLQRAFTDRPTLSTDRHKLVQILTNLVSNAIQAMHSHAGERLMTLCVRDLRDLVEIEVQDNGVGIDEEQMSHMFRYGYTTKASGHGFGLHSSSIDAKLLGGSLSCSSQGRGKGASFVLQLPKRALVLHEDVYTHTADLV